MHGEKKKEWFRGQFDEPIRAIRRMEPRATENYSQASQA